MAWAVPMWNARNERADAVALADASRWCIVWRIAVEVVLAARREATTPLHRFRWSCCF